MIKEKQIWINHSQKHLLTPLIWIVAKTYLSTNCDDLDIIVGNKTKNLKS